ncbi:MAG: hypothetical protein AVDCRST_MAG56-5375 [uncultured Cytophagales bacterium]|uniref:Uncharacterized protein n=1 Tax=uncultured Cytophagales bacterium TaxID=158755 RepID=A0A6J4KAH9_9SPHI|nr:MAG: hypothetical protein AVDCRST_MAG56-5375 [uncultured Cytophagales bacterium]
MNKSNDRTTSSIHLTKRVMPSLYHYILINHNHHNQSVYYSQSS